jgi:hypothetical protein
MLEARCKERGARAPETGGEGLEETAEESIAVAKTSAEGLVRGKACQVQVEQLKAPRDYLQESSEEPQASNSLKR